MRTTRYLPTFYEAPEMPWLGVTGVRLLLVGKEVREGEKRSVVKATLITGQ